MHTSTTGTPAFAGVGSRQTPPEILTQMSEVARILTSEGLTLRSGGAPGADSAFARGAHPQARQIYLPANGHNGHHTGRDPSLIVPDPDALSVMKQIAATVHPAWHRCSAYARALHARNVAIMIGAKPSEPDPAHAVVCWTPGAAITGGTGMAIRLAGIYRIPVYNLARPDLTPAAVIRAITGA